MRSLLRWAAAITSVMVAAGIALMVTNLILGEPEDRTAGDFIRLMLGAVVVGVPVGLLIGLVANAAKRIPRRRQRWTLASHMLIAFVLWGTVAGLLAIALGSSLPISIAVAAAVGAVMGLLRRIGYARIERDYQDDGG